EQTSSDRIFQRTQSPQNPPTAPSQTLSHPAPPRLAPPLRTARPARQAVALARPGPPAHAQFDRSVAAASQPLCSVPFSGSLAAAGGASNTNEGPSTARGVIHRSSPPTCHRPPRELAPCARTDLPRRRQLGAVRGCGVVGCWVVCSVRSRVGSVGDTGRRPRRSCGRRGFFIVSVYSQREPVGLWRARETTDGERK
ncbi:Protein of unknown function, partial [Gryllus bimaculatus]